MAIIKIANEIRSQAFSGNYKSLFDNMLDGLAFCQMIFDPQGRPVDWIYVEVNKNFDKLTGLKGATGKKVTELIPGIASSNPELFEIYGRVSLTGKSESFETYVEPLLRWFLVSAHSPKKNFFVAVFRDITGQKQTDKELENAVMAARNVLEDLQIEKEKLAEAKAKDEAMLLSIADSVVATDKDGRIMFINKMFEAMLGWTEKEIAGNKFLEAIVLLNEKGELIPEAEHPLAKALKGTTTTTTTTTTTYYYKRKDGSLFPVSINAAPIILGKEIIGAIEVFRDITKEKEIEKVRQDFLTLASHQLRTPLSGTKWLIETMQRGVTGKLTQKQNEYITQIYTINERMIGLVYNMLNVLRLESAVPDLQKKTFTLADITKDLLLRTETAAESRGIAIRSPAGGNKFSFETDFEAMKSIFECFISNAINYSQSGQEIVFDFKEGPKEFIFSVRDQGIGIPKDEQKRIFERFYRATNAKKAKPDGTGLGLYAADMLAQRIGAKISFESEEDKGSTFYLHIPKKVEGNINARNNTK